MLQNNVNEEYLRAMHAGQKEKKKLEAAGKDPYPPVLERIRPEVGHCAVLELPVQEVPTERIVGTLTAGRTNAFSASFAPLPGPDSEFAMKWMALCRAHLSDEGIRDPILCYEYLGELYVQEGNKRVSVLRHFGAPRIPAIIRRVTVKEENEEKRAAYEAFLAFHRATGLYDILYRQAGDYQKLYAALRKKEGEPWQTDDVRKFSAYYHHFKTVFEQLRDKDGDLRPEDALLLFFRVYTYEQLGEMSHADLKKALTPLWGDVQASSEPGAITVKTLPNEEEKKGVIGKLITALPRHLNVAFIFHRDEQTSPWTAGHAKGAAHLESALGDAVSVRRYFRADTPSDALSLIERAVEDGADVVFTTTPPLLHQTLKAAVRYPKVRFFNCSACQPLSSVRSYYCRTYEGKFITGLIAGAMARDGKIGYIGSYPILGVPASINAFAAGARMVNPDVRILLSWSCLPGDPVRDLFERGAHVISNRDVPLPDPRFMAGGEYGVVRFDDSGAVTPLASPCWMWGRLYETIVRTILGGNIEKKEYSEAVNYWWGMDSGVIDVTLSEGLPGGVRRLAEHFAELLKAGAFDPFAQEIVDAAGASICDGQTKPTSLELLQMDRLSDAVVGTIPTYGEILPMSRALVRELLLPVLRGSIPPESEDAP